MNDHSSPSSNASSASMSIPRSRLFTICGLLLLASAINYMDRQTLASVSKRITDEFELSEQQYGNLEASFSWSFAIGSLFFGVLADRFSIRWLYPSVLFLWSGVGFMTGFAESYEQLLWCRGLLGLFEAAHWPCALKTTQSLMHARSRAMGNSVLQSGTSIGAILTPLLMLSLLTPEAGSWRIGFQIVGGLGIFWILGWLYAVRGNDLRTSSSPFEDSSRGWKWLVRDLMTRKFLAVLIVVTAINATWQILRAWLPKILIQGRGYQEAEALIFNSAWFVATDVGCLLSGAIALRFTLKGWGIHSSRVMTFGLCVGCCLLLLLVPWLSKGWLLLAVLLVAGAGALGMFPLYYSFTQDISREHQGKVTGITSIIAWCLLAPAQSGFGWLADRTGSYDVGLAIASSLPFVALMALVWVWPRERDELGERETTS